jgi:hypothetical protein
MVVMVAGGWRKWHERRWVVIGQEVGELVVGAAEALSSVGHDNPNDAVGSVASD